MTDTGNVAMVTWDVDGHEHTHFLAEAAVATFGRGADADIRIAYLPEIDTTVPRTVGHLISAAGQLFIRSATRAERSNAISIEREDAPTFELEHGCAWSPPPGATSVKVRVPGDPTGYSLDIEIRNTPLAADPTDRKGTDVRPPILVTPGEYAVIEAYMGDMSFSLEEPREHAEAARMLGYGNTSYPRAVLHKVETRMFHAGFPLGEQRDRRRRIAAGLRHHGVRLVIKDA